ncbi:hypothetical protein AGOR_G00103250 [Albula goreensis]|uniref:Uncharacterized protein n=1 Tax=Albula goreensis TaxID=1534307 RepID=A0A8T3DEA5_9TELE|nr:hypothetical protein AGOR_G00103250 [Albula goreensis]
MFGLLVRRRGQRGVSSTFTVDFNNADVSLEQVLQTPFRLTVKRSRQDPTKKKRKEKDRDEPSGQPATTPEGSVTGSEVAQNPASPDNKSSKPKKKKRKTDSVEKREVHLSNDLVCTKDKSEEEEAGVWERKMSSREKRQLRKERMRRKENPRGTSQQRPLVKEPRWNALPHTEGVWQPRPGETGGSAGGGLHGGPEGRTTGASRRETRPQEAGKAGKTNRRAVEWAPPSRLEEDIFSHVGTWDSKDVKTEPVTFGTVPDLSSEFGNSTSQPSLSQEEWCSQMTSLGVEDAWLGLEDSSDVDQTSDWKPPREEWGNWGGEETPAGQEAGQGQNLGKKAKDGREVLVTQRGVENTPMSDDTDGKKDRKKKRRMRKET